MNSVKSNDIIEEILENFRAGAEEIYEKIVVPEIYWIYLHKSDFEEISQKSEHIVDAAKRALRDEVSRMNEAIDIFEKGVVGKSLSKSLEIYNQLSGILRGKPGKKRIKRKYAEPARGWQISINADVENKCQPGDILIKSIIQFRKEVELQGNKTMRIVTMRIDGEKFVTQEVVENNDEQFSDSFSNSIPLQSIKSATNSPRPFALIHLQTLNGKTTYKMTKNTFAVGRGGTTYWIDLPLLNNPKISQEHLRIHREETSGKFFIKDLSRNGTKLNGKKLPSSLEKSDGQMRENQTQTELKNHSKIQLAGEITLEFEIVK